MSEFDNVDFERVGLLLGIRSNIEREPSFAYIFAAAGAELKEIEDGLKEQAAVKAKEEKLAAAEAEAERQAAVRDQQMGLQAEDLVEGENPAPANRSGFVTAAEPVKRV